MPALSAAELAAWHCDLDDPIGFAHLVIEWLVHDIGVTTLDDANRGIAHVRLERHGEQTTVVVTRRTPAGAKPVRERHPMTSPPPARPREEPS